MARLDQLPDDILMCIIDEAWEGWEDWAEDNYIQEAPQFHFQRSLLYVNKKLEDTVERWMYGRIRQYQNGHQDQASWLSLMLPRPAKHLFMQLIKDQGEDAMEKQYLVKEALNTCPERDILAVKDKHEETLCALAAANLASGDLVPFHDAFTKPDDQFEIHAIEMAFEMKVDPREPCSVGGMIAIREGDIPMLTRLSQKKTFDVNIDHKIFGNPILVAAQMRDLECMKILLALPGKTFLYNGAEFNALHLAARGGDLPMAKLLLEHADESLYPPDQETTALFLAAEKGHLPIVELLLHGLDPPPTTEDIDMAAVGATSAGHEEILKLLWKRSSLPSTMGQEYGMAGLCLEDGDSEDSDVESDGAEDEGIGGGGDFEFEDMPDMEAGTNLAFWATKNDHVNILRFILDADDQFGPYSRSTESSSTSLSNEGQLKEPDSGPESAGYKSWKHEETPKTTSKAKKSIARSCFLAAAKFDSVKVAQLLLDRFEDFGNMQFMGNTRPLIYAAAFSATRVMKLLLERDDVDVNHANVVGGTAISYSIRPPIEPVYRVTDELEALKLMLTREDVNVNCADENGDTPLIWAAIAGDPRMVRALLSRKELDVNAKNRYSETALSRAILLENTSVVKALLAREDIQVNVKNKLGLTPFQMAAKLDYPDIMQLFINRADVDTKAQDTIPHKGKDSIKVSEDTDTAQETLDEEFCCYACSFIHPSAHGVYNGLVPGFSREV
ncbi:pfs [Arthroderma uncinatum]|uniref:pfs n=1 Tax=Arthroderma uncinatum TaxID=74035 RepID=UPI00144AF18E|nr:pfs [Arthroderma uncinatum]KAF3490719.1 pfs [Arthroderma uncinatum]